MHRFKLSPVLKNMGKERRRERKGQTKEKDTKIKGNRNSPSMASDFTDMPDSILLQVRHEL